MPDLPWFFAPISTHGAPVVVDLCCGVGGWTDAFLACGCTVVGYDMRPDKRYNGHLIRCDVRELRGECFSTALAIVASPPCEQFSLANPKRSEPGFSPDLSVVDACFRIGRESGRPLVLENVFGLQRFIGAAAAHYGKFYLWGDGVPGLLPQGAKWKEEYKMRHRSRHLRARIPAQLAAAVARYLVGDVAGGRLPVSSPVIEHREAEDKSAVCRQ